MNYESEFEIFASAIRSLERDTGDDMGSEIFQAIGASKTIVDGLRSLKSYADELKDISKRGEFMRIIGELSLDLAETQIKLSERIREVNDLREQARNLQKEIETLKDPKTKLTIRDGVYWGQDDDDPFCTACYDDKSKLIRVIKLGDTYMPLGTVNRNLWMSPRSLKLCRLTSTNIY